MNFFNRFIPWVCFTAFNIIVLMIIYHYATYVPNWSVETDKSQSTPVIFFSMLCLFYLFPFCQISFFGLFNNNYYSEKMLHNFEYFGIRSLVMLFQAILLSIIYFITLSIFTDKGGIITCILGILYLIWLIIAVISYSESGPVGVFWNTQDYIRTLVNYHDEINKKDKILKTYLNNTQF